MATSFWLLMGYNFRYMIASDTLIDSRGGFSDQAIRWRHGRFRGSKGRQPFFDFLYMGCTLAPPDEYNWTVHVWWRCAL